MKKNILSITLTITVLLLFGIYLYSNPQILIILKDISPIFLLIIMALFLLLFLLEGIFIKVTLDIFDKHIDLKEAYYLSTVSRIGNYLLPMRAGAIFRATYLKNKYQFEYSKFLSTLYAYYILLFLLNSILALLVLLFKYLSLSIFYPVITVFFIVLLLGTLFVILFRKKIPTREGKGLKYINKGVKVFNKFLTSWDMIVKRKKLFLSLLLLTMGNILINGVIFYVEFLSLKIDINILDIVLYTCLSGVSLLVSITPGSLGLREAIFLFTSESIGLSQDQIMQLAFLDRGILFLLLLLLLIVITVFVKKFKLKDIFFVKEKSQ
ncbi:MAG: lysylphosphatidylglycerol synthase transmembrane domain-containing protein [Candidatus Dojkabacteria bacterium]|jgi:uncharacterized protein (TIRG00374 family)|nr:lysylphosphatidylglycerol synthase transmembrane domain-containing protein [Candidatus Dojkabacteria bacterium]